MTILEFASHYNLHDSLIQAIEYKKDSQRLIFRLEFCYWAQDGYNETQQPVGEVNLVFDGVPDYQGLTGKIDYYCILDFTASDNQVHISVLDDYHDKLYQLQFCAKQVLLKNA